MAAIKEYFEKEIKTKDEKIDELETDIISLYELQDTQNQYGWRENIKIINVEEKPGEDTNKIVIDVCKLAGVTLTDADISVSHRLPSYDPTPVRNGKANGDGSPTNAAPKKVKAIIAKLIKRDNRDKVIEGRGKLYENPKDDYPNALIFEDMTPMKSKIMFHLKNRDDKKKFKYVWSHNGRIYARTAEESEQKPLPKAHIVNNASDLMKLGWTKDEVKNIIKNKRN